MFRFAYTVHLKIFDALIKTKKHFSFRLTASSCLMSMSEAFSDMFPTNTVVVGPLSSLALACTAERSFLGTAGLLTTDTEGTITVGVEVMMPTWTGIIGVPTTAKRNQLLSMLFGMDRVILGHNNAGVMLQHEQEIFVEWDECWLSFKNLMNY